MGNIYRRDAAGLQRRSSGIITTDRAQFIPPQVMDPVNPAKLYFGTFRLFRTVNDGIAWTPHAERGIHGPQPLHRFTGCEPG